MGSGRTPATCGGKHRDPKVTSWGEGTFTEVGRKRRKRKQPQQEALEKRKPFTKSESQTSSLRWVPSGKKKIWRWDRGGNVQIQKQHAKRGKEHH